MSPQFQVTLMIRSLFFAPLLCAGVIGCSSKSPEPQTSTPVSERPVAASSSVEITPTSASRAAEKPPPDPEITLHTTSGDIRIRLFASKAPRTVDNFLRGYAERGYYDQTIFHHVQPGQMLIAGGYSPELERKPPRAPIYNESRNGISNRRGTVAMVREPDSPHSATADFFINLADNPAFDYQQAGDEEQHGYCVFGEVVSGMEIVERIAQQSTSPKGDFPSVPSPVATIQSVELMR